MRNSLLFAVVAAFSLPAAAFAVEGTVDVTGSVGVKCMFTNDNATVVIPELSKTSGASTELGRLDPVTVNSQDATLNGWCNGTASTMEVEALPLLHDSIVSPPTGFSNRVDFTATATASPTGGDVSVSDSTTAAGGSPGQTVGIFSSDIDITFSDASAPGDGILIAGSYTGSVVVTLTPSD